MTSEDRNGLIILAIFGLVWWWQKGQGDVTLKQTCRFPDGTEVLVPLGDACPFDPDHGGQSEVPEA